MLFRNSAFVLIYEHRHGVDSSVYSNEIKATRGAIEIVLNWIEDVKDKKIASEILERIIALDYDGALELWGNYQQECSLDPESISVELFPINPKVQSDRTLLVRAYEAAEGISCESGELG